MATKLKRVSVSIPAHLLEVIEQRALGRAGGKGRWIMEYVEQCLVADGVSPKLPQFSAPGRAAIRLALEQQEKRIDQQEAAETLSLRASGGRS